MKKSHTDRAKGHASGSKHKHLGGKGLSLTAFANAKTKTAYNPSQIRKQRENYRNAKKMNKYRKLVRRLEKEGHSDQFQIDRSILEVKQEATTGATVKEDTVVVQQPCHSDMNDNEHTLRTFNDRVIQNHKFESHKRHTNKNTFQKLREVYEKKREEEEKLRKERQAALAAKREAREKAESKRKDIKSKMLRKTHSGQPIMKYRLEHLLDTIQRSNQ